MTIEPAGRLKKILILGGIGVFIVGLFVFFSPLLGIAKHHFNYLPYFGPKETVVVQRDGKSVIDTIYTTVPPFSFVDRHGKPFTDKMVEGRVRGRFLLLHPLHLHLPEDGCADATASIEAR